MHLVLFEDPHWIDLAPLTLSRPACLLMCGTRRLMDAWISSVKPTRVTLWVRPELAGYCRRHVVPMVSVPTSVNMPLDKESAYLVNGRSMPVKKALIPAAALPDTQVSVDDDGSIISATVNAPGMKADDLLSGSSSADLVRQLAPVAPAGKLFKRLWELLDANPDAIARSAESIKAMPLPGGAYHVIEPDRVFIRPGVVIQPGVVLDATDGPIVLGTNVFVGANSVLVGPVYVGDVSRINALAHVGHGTSIGPVCKVGGEIGSSIILGFSNKQHDGYLGDSYLGEWVNFGAGTTTANLKATYSPVSAHVAGKDGPIIVPTSRRSLGSMVGDHTKTAIGTRFSPGSYIGYCAALTTSKTVPAHVPSFRFVTDEGITDYDPSKHPDVAKRVMARRHCEWNADDLTIAEYIAREAGKIER